MKNKKREKRIVANNKKARFDYFIEDVFEAGIVLTGTEIKSIRQGKVSIKESYAKVRKGEIFLLGMNISPYEHGNIFNVDPMRERKLLLNKREIKKIDEINRLKGKSILPLNVYVNEKGLAKIQIGIGTGKKNYDKREAIAKKDAERKMKIATKKYW